MSRLTLFKFEIGEGSIESNQSKSEPIEPFKISKLELERDSGIFGLQIPGSGRARVSRIRPQAHWALEVDAKFILINTKLALKKPAGFEGN